MQGISFIDFAKTQNPILAVLNEYNTPESTANLDIAYKSFIGVCKDAKQVAIIESESGGGKSITLGNIARAYANNNFEILGAGISWEAAEQLRNNLGGTSCKKIDQLMADIRKIKSTKPLLVIIEEAHFLDHKTLNKLKETTEKSGRPTKLILLGDKSIPNTDNKLWADLVNTIGSYNTSKPLRKSTKIK